MTSWDKYKERIASVRHEWDRAEGDIKLAEEVGKKVVYPSIAELRYSGRRLIEALDLIHEDGPEETIVGLLQDAEFDCHRARHDAIDAATATIGIELGSGPVNSLA